MWRYIAIAFMALGMLAFIPRHEPIPDLDENEGVALLLKRLGSKDPSRGPNMNIEGVSAQVGEDIVKQGFSKGWCAVPPFAGIPKACQPIAEVLSGCARQSRTDFDPREYRRWYGSLCALHIGFHRRIESGEHFASQPHRACQDPQHPPRLRP